MSVIIENEPDENIAGYVTYTYPVIPRNMDFETYRKTDDDWKRVVRWYNEESRPEKVIAKRVKKERFVFNQWPRDPKGLTMKLAPRGMHTGNGCELWGATLYDFYRIYRIPSLPNWSTISTGSKITAWMKEAGEDFAQDQLKQAKLEDNPRLLHPYEIGNFIETMEELVSKGKIGKPLKVDRTDSNEGTKCLYAPSQYPAPWPLRPFSIPTARLQKKLHFSHLPRRLIVHDPWDLLCTERINDKLQKEHLPKWGSKDDIIRIYNLNLTGKAKTESRVSGPEPCPVAHLYITPKRRIGSGNHSFVFQAEFELPREVLVEAKACYECALEALENSPSREVRFGKGLTKEERRYYLEKTFKHSRPFEDADLSDDRYQALMHVKFQSKPPYCKHLERGIPQPPSQRVSVTAKLTKPNEDGHNWDGTRKERHQEHLRNEAGVYMDLPNHAYEHWNGYNVIHPLNDPTPVGAVVPQFYGYYTPDECNKPIKKGTFMSPILLLEHCGVQVSPETLSIDHRQECFSLLRRLHLAGYIHNSVYQRNILMQNGPLTAPPFKRSQEHLRFRLIDFGRSEKINEKGYSRESPFQKLTEETGVAYRNLNLELFM